MVNQIISKVVKRVLQYPTPEMYKFFESRTKEHIQRVRDNLSRIATWYDFEPNDIKYRKEVHDRSKYGKEEYIPYVFLTWYHKCKNEKKEYKYPDGMEEVIRKATLHHIVVNPHHPEAHDKPENMSSLDLAEMVADWAAMSQELKTSLKVWVGENIHKWEFTDVQVKSIYTLVNLFPELNIKKRSHGHNLGNSSWFCSTGSRGI